jgi:hypothetical protein
LRFTLNRSEKSSLYGAELIRVLEGAASGTEICQYS